jgi:hypothetical protein
MEINEIHIKLLGLEIGPYSQRHVWRALAEGQLLASDAARHEGTETWTTVGELLARLPPPATPELVPAAPETIQKSVEPAANPEATHGRKLTKDEIAPPIPARHNKKPNLAPVRKVALEPRALSPTPATPKRIKNPYVLMLASPKARQRIYFMSGTLVLLLLLTLYFHGGNFAHRLSGYWTSLNFSLYEAFSGIFSWRW